MKTDLPCRIDGCPNVTRTIKSDLCEKHYTRQRRHGDPNVVRRPDLPTGPNHHRWSKENVSYRAVHGRVERLHGKAAEHPCADCGHPAAEWSYDHSDLDEKICPVDGFVYSAKVEHYQPRCVPCHRTLDFPHERRLAI